MQHAVVPARGCQADGVTHVTDLGCGEVREGDRRAVRQSAESSRDRIGSVINRYEQRSVPATSVLIPRDGRRFADGCYEATGIVCLIEDQ